MGDEGAERVPPLAFAFAAAAAAAAAFLAANDAALRSGDAALA